MRFDIQRASVTNAQQAAGKRHRQGGKKPSIPARYYLRSSSLGALLKKFHVTVQDVHAGPEKGPIQTLQNLYRLQSSSCSFRSQPCPGAMVDCLLVLGVALQRGVGWLASLFLVWAMLLSVCVHVCRILRAKKLWKSVKSSAQATVLYRHY